MKKILILLLLLGYLNIYAAKPIVQIPKLPNEEAFDSPEEMFTIKTLEYLSYAIALQTQINMLGEKPAIQVTLPTFEQLSDQEYSLIRKYYIIAKKLEKQVIGLDENLNRKHIAELRQQLIEQNKKYDSLYYATLKNYLSAQKIDYYKNKIDSLIYDNTQLFFKLDSSNVEFYNKLKLQRELILKIFNEYYKYTQPVLSVSAAANHFMVTNDNLSSKLSVSSEISINLYPLFDFGKFLDVWLKYTHPVFISTFRNDIYFPENKIDYIWNTDFYSVGLNGNISIINRKDFLLGFKIGVGQYWGISRLFNQSSPETTYNGQELKFEINFSKNSVYAPFEFYLGFSSFFNSDIPKLNLYNLYESNFGNKNFNSLSLGVRFVIIRANRID